MENLELSKPELSGEEQLKENLRGLLREYDPGLVSHFMAARKGFGKIFEQAREKIDGHYYSSILGDDTSGRIPGLIFYRALEKIYGNQDKPPMFFLQGGKEREQNSQERWQKVSQFINQNKDQFGNHPLLVTELMATGASIGRFKKAFFEQGIDLECAILYQMPSRMIEDYTNENDLVGLTGYEVGYGWRPFEEIDERSVGVARSEDVHSKKIDELFTQPIRKAVAMVAENLALEYLNQAVN